MTTQVFSDRSEDSRTLYLPVNQSLEAGGLWKEPDLGRGKLLGTQEVPERASAGSHSRTGAGGAPPQITCRRMAVPGWCTSVFSPGDSKYCRNSDAEE